MKIKKIIDVSRKIKPNMTVWIGDYGVSIEEHLSIKNGDECNYTSISFGVHTGTHIDAPKHFIDNGKEIEDLDLSRFIGFTKVYDFMSDRDIRLEDLKELDICKDDIVLFKTKNSKIEEDRPFSEDFVSFDVSAAKYLVEMKIKTVGIDYLSIESANSPFNEVHNILLANEIGIVEGLNLSQVNEGEYFLSCLPLRIQGVEGSPVRAVLIEYE